MFIVCTDMSKNVTSFVLLARPSASKTLLTIALIIQKCPLFSVLL